MTSHGAARRAIDPHNTNSLAGKARQRRWAEFATRFPDVGDMRVLDLGGTPPAWLAAPVRPAHVTTINLAPFDTDADWITHVVGDACDLPYPLSTGTYDIVFSNSLLEHLGGHVQRQRFAGNVHERAERHWVQTPYRYFPIEPHWLFPGMQFLPHAARVWVSVNWQLGHIRTPTRAIAMERVNEVELIGATQMRDYFPNSDLWFERLAGVPKSLVAVKV